LSQLTAHTLFGYIYRPSKISRHVESDFTSNILPFFTANNSHLWGSS